jgi:peptidoglycan/LPS O-acetylase OafA/YrhL
MAKTTTKIAYLDGIRGVAAFLVFFHHFLLAFYSAFFSFEPKDSNLHGWDIRYGQSLFSVFSNGHFCVCIFFVLSGFVLSRKYFQSNSFEIIVSGAHRRFIRLYIPIAFTMILSFLLMKAGLYYNMQVYKFTHSDWWLAGLWNFPDPFSKLLSCLKADTMFLGDASFDTSLWTMAIEFTGSLFVFGFLALTHNARQKFLTLFLVFLYCKWTNSVILTTFVFGISLNYVEQLVPLINKYLATFVSLLLLLAGLVLGSFPSNNVMKGTFFDHKPEIFLSFSPWFHVAGAYFLVLAFVLSRPFQRAISLRIFRFLGYISFSFYLIHPLVIGSFSCYLFLRIHERFGYNHSVIYIFALTTGICLLLSWLMARYIDDPGIKCSKYVYNRWFRKHEKQPVVNEIKNE